MLEKLRHGSAEEVLQVFSTLKNLNHEELCAALANAFERIAVMERQWKGLERAYAWYNKQVKARGIDDLP